MYYLGIAYYLFQEGLGPRYWLGNQTHISIFNIFSNFTFLHGFNPYGITSTVPGGWSIAVEMTFYAILPFLFSRIKNTKQAFNFFLLSLFVKLSLHLLLMNFSLINSNDDRLWKEYLFLYFPSQLPVFCLGILLFFVVIEKDSTSNISGKSILLFSAILIAQFGIGLPFILTKHILFGIAFFLLALGLSKFQFVGIVNPVVNYIGKISFSMYLVHFAVLHWLLHFKFVEYFNNGILNYITRFAVASTLTIAISSIFYKMIELPFQAMGKRVIDKLEGNMSI